MIHAVLENALRSRWAELLPRAPHRRGELHDGDCELVPLGDGRLLALATNSVEEEIRLGLFRDPATAGRLAAAASLSDLAAVGADPIGLLLTVALPARDRASIQASVARGVSAASLAAGTFVLGSDTNRAEALQVGTVGIGALPEATALCRRGLQVGDRLFASGPLGTGAALAAARLLGRDDGTALEAAFAPPPRLEHGRALRGIASACMPTSAGLVAALDQLARVNRITARVDAPLLGLLSPEAARTARALALPPLALLAGHHGEFELVFGVPHARLGALEAAARRLDWRPLPIGWVGVGTGLLFGNRPLDGARIRNLAHAAGGDACAYARALVALCAEASAA